MHQGPEGEPGAGAAPADATRIASLAGPETQAIGLPAALLRLSAPPAAIPLLLAVGLLLFVVNLGGYPVYTKGEAREAVIVLDMLHGGGLALPMRAGVELPSKPPLMHWLGALLSLLFGRADEWTVRLPSALFALGGMLACYAYVRRLFDEPTAFLAALILGTTLQYLQAGSGARVDMTLTFFMEIAFFQFVALAEGVSRRTTPLYFALALAVLAKGPVGLALPVMVAAVWLVRERRLRTLRTLGLGRGALIVLALAGGWYAAAIATGGMPFVRKQLFAENVFRLLPSSAFQPGHSHPFYYVELALLAGFMPWSAALVIPVAMALKRPPAPNPRLSYVFVWFVLVLLFYNLPVSKRGVYLLALYPALATLLAVYARQVAEDSTPVARWLKPLQALAGFALLLSALLAAAVLLGLAFYPAPLSAACALIGIMTPGFLPALGAAVAAHRVAAAGLTVASAALALYAFASRATIERVAAVTVAGAVCLTLAANLFVQPALGRTLTLKPFAQRLDALVGGSSVGYLGALNYGVAFYTGRHLPLVSLNDSALPCYLIAPRRDYEMLGPAANRHFAIVLESNPTNLDGTGTILLLRRLGGPAPCASAPAPPRTPT